MAINIVYVVRVTPAFSVVLLVIDFCSTLIRKNRSSNWSHRDYYLDSTVFLHMTSFFFQRGFFSKAKRVEMVEPFIMSLMKCDDDQSV